MASLALNNTWNRSPVFLFGVKYVYYCIYKTIHRNNWNVVNPPLFESKNSCQFTTKSGWFTRYWCFFGLRFRPKNISHCFFFSFICIFNRNEGNLVCTTAVSFFKPYRRWLYSLEFGSIHSGTAEGHFLKQLTSSNAGYSGNAKNGRPSQQKGHLRWHSN